MQHRSRRRISVVATVAVLVVALVGCAKDDPAGPISAQAAATTTKPPTIQGDWADTGYLVADATGPKVTLYTDPADDKVNPYKASIDNPTWEGLPAVFLVLDIRFRPFHVLPNSMLPPRKSLSCGWATFAA